MPIADGYDSVGRKFWWYKRKRGKCLEYLIPMHEEEMKRIWCKNAGIAFGKEQVAVNIYGNAWNSRYVDANMCTLGVNEEEKPLKVLFRLLPFPHWSRKQGQQLRGEIGGGVGNLRRKKWWDSHLGEWATKVLAWEWAWAKAVGEGPSRGWIPGVEIICGNIENPGIKTRSSGDVDNEHLGGMRRNELVFGRWQ